MKIQLELILLLPLILNSCGPAVLVPLSTPTLISPTITPSPMPKPKAECPKAGSPTIPTTYPSDDIELQKIILAYINQGGAPEQLIERFAKIDKTKFVFKVSGMDIDGDGINELLLSSSNWDFGMPESTFWIFQCATGKYEVLYSKSYGNNPRVVAVMDLNGDGQKEIVIQSDWFGSGCLEDFDIVGWEKNSLVHYIEPYISFPCKTNFEVGSIDDNGNKEILFQGLSDGRYDAVAGIQRNFVDTYVLNNQTYALKSHVYLPSPYRIYAIYDAQQALDKGNYDLATQLYEKAAHEDLKDVDSLIFATPLLHGIEKWPQNFSRQDHPKEYIKSFSLFRLVLLYLLIGNDQKMASTLNELDTNFPAGKFGFEFTDLAHLMKDQFKAGRGITLSCNAVAAEIEKQYPYLGWHFDWSIWTVFSYNTQTFCPYSEDVNWLSTKYK